MSARFAAVVLGTPRPIELAAFYADLLGWDTVSAAPDWVRLRDPERERPGLSFQLEAGFVAPDWPGTDTGAGTGAGTGADPGAGVQMQSHLDVLVDDLDAEVARAESLGARLESAQPQDDVRVLRDPHGHLFCLFTDGA